MAVLITCGKQAGLRLRPAVAGTAAGFSPCSRLLSTFIPAKERLLRLTGFIFPRHIGWLYHLDNIALGVVLLQQGITIYLQELGIIPDKALCIYITGKRIIIALFDGFQVYISNTGLPCYVSNAQPLLFTFATKNLPNHNWTS